MIFLKHFLKRFFVAVVCLCLLAGSVTAFADEKDQVFSDLSVIDVNGRQLRLADWETMSFEEILTQIETAGFMITTVYVYEEKYKFVERENDLTHDVIMNLYNSYDFENNSFITMQFASDPLPEYGKTLTGKLEFGRVSGIIVSCNMASEAKFGAVGASGEKMKNGDFSELTGAYPLTAGGQFQASYLTRDYSYCAGGNPGRAVGIDAGAKKYEFCSNRWKPDHTTPKEAMKPADNPELFGALSTITYNGKSLRLSDFSEKTGPEILDALADFGLALYHNGYDLVTVQQAKDMYNAPEFTTETFDSSPMSQNSDIDRVHLWISKDRNEVTVTVSNRNFTRPAITFTAAGISVAEMKDVRVPRLRAEYPQLKGTLEGTTLKTGTYRYKNGDSKIEFRIQLGDNFETMSYSFTTKYKN